LRCAIPRILLGPYLTFGVFADAVVVIDLSDDRCRPYSLTIVAMSSAFALVDRQHGHRYPS
jgi:hypothetical protein